MYKFTLNGHSAPYSQEEQPGEHNQLPSNFDPKCFLENIWEDNVITVWLTALKDIRSWAAANMLFAGFISPKQVSKQV